MLIVAVLYDIEHGIIDFWRESESENVVVPARRALRIGRIVALQQEYVAFWRCGEGGSQSP